MRSNLYDTKEKDQKKGNRQWHHNLSITTNARHCVLRTKHLKIFLLSHVQRFNSKSNKLKPPFQLANYATACYYFLWTKPHKRLVLSCVQRFNAKSTNNFKCEQTSTSITISGCLRRSPWRRSPWCYSPWYHSPWCILSHSLVLESFLQFHV